MGQITSQISGYFTGQENTEKNEQQNGVINLEGKENFVYKKSSKINYRKLENSVGDPASSSFTSFASPRQPIKRSRPLSPSAASLASLPQSILDIFSPAKKPRIEEEFLDFPFLDDNKTVNYIHKSKVIIILRGLPGSGKSTIAKRTKKKYFSSCEVCSADSFFMKNGQYNYDVQLIGEAHNQCQQNAINAALAQKSVIVIDNTNLKLWEMKFYLDLASAFNYIPIPVEPLTPWSRDLDVLVTKNSHCVDKNNMEFKLQSFEEIQPYYYGWFLNERDSSMLIEEMQMWIEEAYQHSEFREDLSYYTGTQNLEDLLQYYQKPGEGMILHCTSKFTGRGLVVGSHIYMEKEAVRNSVGKAFDTEVVGYVISPRTLGARVQLSQEQLTLWEGLDDEEIPDEFWTVRCEMPAECNTNGIDQNSLNSKVEAQEPQHISESPKGNLELMDESNIEFNGISDSSMADLSEQGEPDVSPDLQPPVSDEINSSDSTITNTIKVNGCPVSETFDEITAKKVTTNGNCDKIDDEVSKVSGVVSAKNESDTSEKGSPSKQNKKNYSKKNKRSNRQMTEKVSIPKNTISIKDSKTSSTISDVPQNPHHKDRYNPTSGLGQRAHVTLGCAPSIKAVTTGLDLLFAIQKEQQSIQSNEGISKINTIDASEESKSVAHVNVASDSTLDSQQKEKSKQKPTKNMINIQGTVVKNYGHGLWVVYPQDKLRMSSIFAFV